MGTNVEVNPKAPVKRPNQADNTPKGYDIPDASMVLDAPPGYPWGGKSGAEQQPH